MPVSVRERSERRTRTLRVSYLVVSLGCAALLAVVCRLGVRLAGTVSVSAAWEQFTARVASDPRFQVVVSALQEGGSADFIKQLLFALADAAAGDGRVTLLPPDDLLQTAAAFREAEVESVRVTEDRITVRFSCGGLEEAQSISAELGRLDAWRAVELDVSRWESREYTLSCVRQ